MTPDLLTRVETIERRVKEATPGPWRALPLRHGDGCDGIIATHNHPLVVVDDDGFEHCFSETQNCWQEGCPARQEIVTTDSGVYGPKWADAELIQHAPTDLAFLCAEVRRQQGIIQAVEAANRYAVDMRLDGFETREQIRRALSSAEAT